MCYDNIPYAISLKELKDKYLFILGVDFAGRKFGIIYLFKKWKETE